MSPLYKISNRPAKSLSRMTPTGFEPMLPPWKGGVLTAWPWGHTYSYFSLKMGVNTLTPTYQAPRVGLEPTTTRLTAECSTIELSGISPQWIISLIPSFEKRKISFPENRIRIKDYLLPWLSFRPISNSQLRTSLHFHLCPINLVVFKGSYVQVLG